MTPISNYVTITPINVTKGLVNYPCGIAVVDAVSDDIKCAMPAPGTNIIYSKGGVTKFEGVNILHIDHVLATL